MTKLAQSARQLFDTMDKDVRQQVCSKTNIFNWSLDLLLEDGDFNTRDYDSQRVKDKIRAYADGWHRGDAFPPIQVKVIDGKIYIRDGYLRTRGARLAVSEGAVIDRLPCTEVIGDEAVQDLVILKSNDGLPLLPLERAAVYVRMMNVRGLTVEEISKLDGRTVTSIMTYINAYSLPRGLKTLVNNESMSLTVAIELFNKHGTSAVQIAEKLLSEMSNGHTTQSDLIGNTQKKAPRLTQKRLESVTGYRSRFNRKLVEEVTDSFRALKTQLETAKKSNDGYQVTLTDELMEAFKRLSLEVEPKSKDVKKEEK